METEKNTAPDGTESGPAKKDSIILDPFQEIMAKTLGDLMCKNISINHDVMYRHIAHAIFGWQKATGMYLRDAADMGPNERIRIGKTIFELLRDSLIENFRGIHDRDEINRALDITLKYYEDNFAYR